MKKFSIYIICLSATLAGWTSCSDFLDRIPETSITPEGFFRSTNDLELYSNTFYDLSSGFGRRGIYNDVDADNYFYSVPSTYVKTLLTGTTKPENCGYWSDWGKLRMVNYMLDHAVTVTDGTDEDKNHYLGVARFFRAWFYVDKVLMYSDVPWYGKALESDDPDIFKARDPRTLVVDSILNDMQFAVDNLKATMGTKAAVHKYAALAFMARFCVYEGTWRKYHSELGLENSANTFFEKAVWACEQLINSQQFAIEGNSPEAYRALFTSPGDVLAQNKDCIMQFYPSQAANIGQNVYIYLENPYVGVSQSLAETYLMLDGTPFTSTPGYNEKTYLEIFKDRDPRMAETIAPPGWILPFENQAYYRTPSTGGYGQLKNYPIDLDLRKGWDMCYNAQSWFRYAEVLLNYAEAKAELGTLTQNDLDISVNKLRERVGMPGRLDLGKANSNPDPYLADAYDKVSGANKGVILEIRRERRVEMAFEELRLNDLKRWGAGKLISQHQKGMYIPALGVMDVTADGVPDIAIIGPNDPEPAGVSIILRVGENEAIALDGPGGLSGHITYTADKINKLPFEEPKWYYYPIPLSETVLNPQLKQIQGW